MKWIRYFYLPHRGYENGETANSDYHFDNLLLAVSQQQLQRHIACHPQIQVTMHSVNLPTALDLTQSAEKVKAVKKSRIPKKKQANTVWAKNIWREWAA